jgi:hypothetical protein
VLVPRVEVSHEGDNDGRQFGPPERGCLTLYIVPGGELEGLVEEDDGEGELHDGHPLGKGEMSNLEYVLLEKNNNRRL